MRANETEQIRRLIALLNKWRLELDDSDQIIKQDLISDLISVFDRYFPSSEEQELDRKLSHSLVVLAYFSSPE